MTGHSINQIITESGTSGAIPFVQRPEAASYGPICNEVAKLDRFSRNLFDYLQISQELQRRGVNLFLLDVVERDRMLERIKATKQQLKARGEYSGGVAPFGWAYDNDKRLVPDPAAQLVIKRIRRLSDRGLSPHRISEKLREEGQNLSHVTVRQCIVNRRWLYA